MILPEATKLPSAPMGVIEALVSGFESLASNPSLMLLPVLLDGFAWLGPRIDFRPAIAIMLNPFLSADKIAKLAIPPMSLIDTGVSDISLNTLNKIQNVFLGGGSARYFPFVPTLSLPILPVDSSGQFLPVTPMGFQVFQLSGIPLLFSGRPSTALPFTQTPYVFSIVSPTLLVLSYLIIPIIGFLLWIVYLGTIAHHTRQNPQNIWAFIKQYVMVLFQLGIIFPLIAIVGIVFIRIYLLLISLASLVGMQCLLLLVNALIMTGIVWAMTFLFFTTHGMFLNNRNLITSAWDSIRLVQWNLMPTFGLLVSAILIYTALYQIWQLADPKTWLAPLAILGNAFVGTGLTVATFIYFQDRYQHWQAVRQLIIEELRNRQEIDFER
jgi:hypothetical protein